MTTDLTPTTDATVALIERALAENADLADTPPGADLVGDFLRQCSTGDLLRATVRMLAERDATIAQLRDEVRTLTGTEDGIRVVLEAKVAKLDAEATTWKTRLVNETETLRGHLAEAREQVAQLTAERDQALNHQARFGKPGGPVGMTVRYETQYYYGPDEECGWTYWVRGELDEALARAEAKVNLGIATGAAVREYSVFTYHSDVKVLGSFGKVPSDEASGTTAGGDHPAAAITRTAHNWAITCKHCGLNSAAYDRTAADLIALDHDEKRNRT